MSKKLKVIPVPSDETHHHVYNVVTLEKMRLGRLKLRGAVITAMRDMDKG